MSRRRRLLGGPLAVAAATAFYAAVAIVWTWPLVLTPTTHVAARVDRPHEIDPDRSLAIALAARNAGALLDAEPSRWFHPPVCHPMPLAVILGEHGIELGLLALPGYWASGSPVLAYNSACLLMLLVAGVSMFALVRRFTGSAGAGLIAGLIFAFHPARLDQLAHPYVVGIHWMPLVLLLFERLIESGRVRDALLLALVTGLQVLVGSYPLMILVAFGVPYGGVRLVQRRTSLDRRRVLLLLGSATLVAVLTAAVLAPYLTASSIGSVLAQRDFTLLPYLWILPGQMFSVGIVVLLLAGVLLVLRPGRGSPAFPAAAGALGCFLLAGTGAPWPGGPELAGIFPWLAEQVPLLGTVRVPTLLRSGIYLGLAMLGGLGFARLLDRIRPGRAGGSLACAGVVVLVLVEIFHPTVSAAVYRGSRSVELIERAPRWPVLEAYEVFNWTHNPGPVLDIPHVVGIAGFLHTMPEYTLLAAYHGHTVAACSNSFLPPSHYAVARMAARLPSQRGVEELAAAGFRNLVFHDRPLRRGKILPGAQLLHHSPDVQSYRLTTSAATHSDATLLRASGGMLRERHPGALEDVLTVVVENGGSATWVLPHPLQSLVMRLRCRVDELPGPWRETRLLLPLALAPGQTDPVPVSLSGLLPRSETCPLEVEIPELGWRLAPDQIADQRPSPL